MQRVQNKKICSITGKERTNFVFWRLPVEDNKYMWDYTYFLTFSCELINFSCWWLRIHRPHSRNYHQSLQAWCPHAGCAGVCRDWSTWQTWTHPSNRTNYHGLPLVHDKLCHVLQLEYVTIKQNCHMYYDWNLLACNKLYYVYYN